MAARLHLRGVPSWKSFLGPILARWDPENMVVGGKEMKKSFCGLRQTYAQFRPTDFSLGLKLEAPRSRSRSRHARNGPYSHVLNFGSNLNRPEQDRKFGPKFATVAELNAMFSPAFGEVDQSPNASERVVLAKNRRPGSYAVSQSKDNMRKYFAFGGGQSSTQSSGYWKEDSWLWTLSCFFINSDETPYSSSGEEAPPKTYREL
ncbi:hypothetical protein FPV67DRAFT_1451197 [Lyophyllum atratum]|nr:hypothetical protein FPV67DRAFT_1451197 [Lyophyllum atratum]